MRLFDSVPAREADPRQQQYRDSVATMLQQFQAHGGEMPVLAGMTASHVDLGWIQDHVRRYVRAQAPSFEQLAELFDAELPQVVQRVKEIRLGNIGWPDVIELAFETKDDASSYFYRLFVPLVD